MVIIMIRYLKAKSDGSNDHCAKVTIGEEPLELFSYDEMIDEMMDIFENNNIVVTKEIITNATSLAAQFLKCLTGIVFIKVKM